MTKPARALDPHYEKLVQDGYVELAGCLDPRRVREVEELVDPLFETAGNRVRELRPGLVREINRAVGIEPGLRWTRPFVHCQELASRWLGRQAKYCFDHVIYKDPGPGSAIYWHQDQAYQRFDLAMRSIHFWIPLCELEPDSGGLEFVPGSHRFGILPHVHVPGSTTLAVSGQDDWDVRRSSVRLGGMSAHVAATVHRSGQNLSSRTRKAWILHFGPNGKLDALRPDNVAAHCRRLLRRPGWPDPRFPG